MTEERKQELINAFFKCTEIQFRSIDELCWFVDWIEEGVENEA